MPNQDEARAKLRAFLADLQAVCAKHGCVIRNYDENGIGLEVEGARYEELHLRTYDITATTADEAEWSWGTDEGRIAGKPVDHRFAMTTYPDLPEGTPYTAKVWKTEPL